MIFFKNNFLQIICYILHNWDSLLEKLPVSKHVNQSDSVISSVYYFVQLIGFCALSELKKVTYACVFHQHYFSRFVSVHLIRSKVCFESSQHVWTETQCRSSLIEKTFFICYLFRKNGLWWLQL